MEKDGFSLGTREEQLSLTTTQEAREGWGRRMGQPLAQVAACDTSDIDRAVTAARRAFGAGTWSRMKPADRKKVLLKYADLLEANASELALLDKLEAGKPIGDYATMDILDTAAELKQLKAALEELPEGRRAQGNKP